jgi:hypothetical protein
VQRHIESTDHPPRTTPRRRARLAWAAARFGALTLVALFAAACGSSTNGPGVASAGGTPTSNKASQTSSKASPLAFSRCMRAHGIHDFPDPDTQGRLTIQAGPGSDMDPQSPTFQHAQQACQSLQPKPSPARQAQMQANALKFSQCMRSHGVHDFPDPTTQSGGGVGIRIQGGKGGDLDPQSPVFQAAQKACQHIMGGGPGASTHTANGGPGGGGFQTGGKP